MSNTTPIACDLSAIAEENIEDHKHNAETIFNAITKVRETEDGYAFRLPPETGLISKAGSFIARERQCCPFFEFSITVPPQQDPVWLTLTGREGVKPYIKETVLPKLDARVVNIT
ncbi:hypothetical protein NC796_01745 [Aliifodinibius sp. S!AR15-10]|uniref:hypothetical protein n=1 Tax=Aliifodinibius sp. S!AR15-10 TaxID=2950437 RepID=UPI00285D5D27|nr:hypothetical protein [Aliifodinibius sp. S!AR15-10]MDR8389841.1 hypothetical protein [Aliifodinibius sp. S!AR15-10]